MSEYESMFRQMFYALQRHGFQDIMGSVWKVWRQGGEQKIQALLGYAANGEPVLSSFMKVAGTPSGPQREQFKFFKGMNVKITGGQGDGRQATMTPTAENDANPEPKYANDYHHTYQYGSYHRRIGADSHEHFMVQEQSGSGGGGSGGTAMAAKFGAAAGPSGVTSGAGQQQADPYQDAIIVKRKGKKPQVQQVNGPWDGPNEKGNPIKQTFHWVGKQGEASQADPGDKEQIFHGFGNRTKTTHEDGTITKAVGQLVKQIWTDVGSDITGGGGTSGGGGASGLISSLVGQTKIDMNPSSILQKATGIQIGAGNNLDLKGAIASLVGNITRIAGSPVKQQKTVMLGGLSLNLPSGLGSAATADVFDEAELRMGDPADDIYFTSSYSSATAPNDSDLGTPFPGMRWIDTTSGIEYSWNVVWSEGGGNVVFPATPNIGDTFNYGDRQWAWNGVGWASTLSSRATALETATGSLSGGATTLAGRVTSLESRVTVLEGITVIDGGTF